MISSVDSSLEEALQFFNNSVSDVESEEQSLEPTPSDNKLCTSSSSSSVNRVVAIRASRKSKVSRKPISGNRQKIVSVGEQTYIATMPQAVQTFDRTNFLIYLPAVITNYMNSGDLKGLRQIIKSRSAKTCQFSSPYHPEGIVGAQYISKFYEMILSYHPDGFSYATSISVHGNEIRSTFTFKCTDNVKLNNFVSHMYQSTPEANIFISTRGNVLDYIDKTGKSPEDLALIQQLDNTDLNLTVYGRGMVRIVFNEQKKITHYEVSCKLFDVKPAL